MTSAIRHDIDVDIDVDVDIGLSLAAAFRIERWPAGDALISP
jgi:hypothetical protein